jgi:CheY-like chemotaxis protein
VTTLLVRERPVLLAEDNPVSRRIAIHIVEGLGYMVDVAGNGRLLFL